MAWGAGAQFGWSYAIKPGLGVLLLLSCAGAAIYRAIAKPFDRIVHSWLIFFGGALSIGSPAITRCLIPFENPVDGMGSPLVAVLLAMIALLIASAWIVSGILFLMWDAGAYDKKSDTWPFASPE